jgi:nucleotide-binding universal stress UspA family protein
MRYSTILVPLDGSTLAEEALAHAVGLSVGAGGTLLLLRAAETRALPIADPTDAQRRVVREADEYLAGIQDRLRRQGVTKVETSVWYGPAPDAIVDAARFCKADLIVMSTHGRSGVGRLVLGSVAERVLRTTSTPILLIRHCEAPLDEVVPARGLHEEASLAWRTRWSARAQA